MCLGRCLAHNRCPINACGGKGGKEGRKVEEGVEGEKQGEKENKRKEGRKGKMGERKEGQQDVHVSVLNGLPWWLRQ